MGKMMGVAASKMHVRTAGRVVCASTADQLPDKWCTKSAVHLLTCATSKHKNECVCRHVDSHTHLSRLPSTA
jgi:hypothetical protein